MFGYEKGIENGTLGQRKLKKDAGLAAGGGKGGVNGRGIDFPDLTADNY